MLARRCIAYLVLLGSFAASVRAQGLSAAAVQTTVDHAAHDFFRATPEAVGVSVGVLLDGKTYVSHYGTVVKGTVTPPGEHTLYPIASITKTFTGTLLAQAAIEGKLSLTDDIRKYLDGTYPNLEFEGHPIRICDLVDHRSGLPFYLPDNAQTQPDYNGNVVPWTTRVLEQTAHYTRADFYADLRKVKLTAVPGTVASYSNAGAKLAGYILERVYGVAYPVLLERKILRPLRMTETTLTPSRLEVQETATGYDENGRTMPNYPVPLGADGGIRSNVGDMLKYAGWQLAATDAAVKLSHQAYATTGNYSAGLNWQMMTDGDRQVIWQSGNIPGYASYCVLEPRSNVALVVLSNEASPASGHQLFLMVNRILSSLDSRAVPLP